MKQSRRGFLGALLSGATLTPRFARGAPGIPDQEKTRAGLPRYEDVAARAGLTAKTIIGGEKTKRFILESTGGGVALFDYDNDGWLDIFLVNGSRLEGFSPGQEPTNHLYRNNRDGTFTDVTAAAGLSHHGWGQGVCVGDFDNDGNTDLLVTYYGQNVFYRNNGDGTFTDITRKAGLISPENRYYTGAAFLDYDGDGKLDLFLTCYVAYNEALQHNPDQEAGCRWKGLKVFCGPRGLQGARCFLYRNNGDGTFTDVSEKAGIHDVPLVYGFTPLVMDYDNDGRPDVYVACDSSRSLLFHNNGDGTFKETGVMAGVAYNEDGREQAGMGVSAGDYDSDGWLDIVKTNFADDTTTLYHNQGGGLFSDATFSGHLGGNTTYLGWGTGFFDFDNDGWPDILIANGHVYPEVQNQRLDSNYAQRKILYRSCRNGTFEDISAAAGGALLEPKVARGAAFGDLFNTGQIDIVVNNLNDTPTILHNAAPAANQSLVLQLIGTKSNRSAIGARVTVETRGRRMIDEVRSGGSFCSQNDLRLHFGLGAEHSAEIVRVRWANGRIDEFRGVPAGHLTIIEEGRGILRTFPFAAAPSFSRARK